MRLRTRGRLNLKHLSRALDDRLRGTPFDRTLRDARAAGRRDFVFGWNRGLGDIALGLVPLFARIRESDPRGRITVYTRPDLAEPFALTDADAIHVVPGLARGTPVDLAGAARGTGTELPANAVLFADPDPTRWLDGQRQRHPPVLHWNAQWNALADAMLPPAGDEMVIGAHVNSETARYYGYVKDWPAAAWQALLSRFPAASGVRWVLFGNAPVPSLAGSNVVDLRARTSFLALLAAIRTRCRVLVAPDSGVLTAAYYLADDFPLDVVSLWSDPRQGILKQGCASPNPRLRHVPLFGRAEDVRNLEVEEVSNAVAAALAAPPARHAPPH